MNTGKYLSTKLFNKFNLNASKLFYNYNLFSKSFNSNYLKNKNLTKYMSYINTSKKNFSTVYVNHKDSFENNEKAPFDFTKENYEKVDEILVSLILKLT